MTLELPSNNLLIIIFIAAVLFIILTMTSQNNSIVQNAISYIMSYLNAFSV